MILGIGKTVSEQQQAIHAGESYELWQHLAMRYDLQELTNVFLNFANDADFKAILGRGITSLEKEVVKLEDEMKRLGVPMPKRPPRSVNTPANTEILRDETMFRSIYMIVQLFQSQLQKTLLMIVDPRLRDVFKQMQVTEADIYTKMVTYGKGKGWLPVPPAYRGGT